MESIIEYLRQANPIWVYGVLFIGSYIENLLPPAPGDAVMVFGAYLAGRGVLDFTLTYSISTVGSLAGFMTMYGLGRTLDKKVISTGKWRFFSGSAFIRVEKWFVKYGFWIIAGNRFFSGVRAVVSLFAGIVRLDVRKVFILAAVSCLLWNGIIVYAGAKVGENWETVITFIKNYNVVAFLVILGICCIVFIRWFIKKKMNAV